MLKVEKIEDIVIVKFDNVDRFNALVTEPVKEEVKALLSPEGTKLILDLDGIKFIDSSGFGVFLSLMRTAADNKGTFKICCISDSVMELFKLLQLNTIFDISDSLDDCIKSMA
jgi:anti-sigma B factor antagonist